MVLWMLGYPDRGLAAAEQCMREAENSKNRWAVTFAGAQLHIVVLFRREFGRALELAELDVRRAADKQFRLDTEIRNLVDGGVQSPCTRS